MPKLFGTDGIRGTVNSHPMTSRIAMDVAVAAGLLFREQLTHRPTVLIAKDTRLSGYQIEPAMVTDEYLDTGLLSGIDQIGSGSGV